MLSTLTWLLPACGSGPGSAPLHYPALPSAGQAVAVASVFEPGPTLRAFAPSCRPSEPPLANALDDDCDGRVDGAAAELAIALAYPRTTGFSFALREAGKGERALAQPACDRASAFCTLRLGPAELGAGHPELVVRRSDPAQPAASVLISVQTAGKVSSYIAPPHSPEQTPQALGRIAAP